MHVVGVDQCVVDTALRDAELKDAAARLAGPTNESDKPGVVLVDGLNQIPRQPLGIADLPDPAAPLTLEAEDT